MVCPYHQQKPCGWSSGNHSALCADRRVCGGHFCGATADLSAGLEDLCVLRVSVDESYLYSDVRKGEIIFYGASNFARWGTLDEDMSEYKVQNHAFGGSTDVELVGYAPELLFPYEPAVVFFQTGSNDYVQQEGTDEEKIAKCMNYKKAMFADFHEKMPDAKFVIMSGLLLRRPWRGGWQGGLCCGAASFHAGLGYVVQM